MDFSFRNLSNEERLFLAVPPAAKPSVASYRVEGCRTDTSSGGPVRINGQQLMMQVDCLTSAMMDMDVSVVEEMENETVQHGTIQQSSGGNVQYKQLDENIQNQQQEQKQSQK